MNRIVMKGVLDGIVVDRIVRDEEYTMPSVHFHPEFEIYYLMEGSRLFFIEDKTYPMSKGDLALINSELIHKTSAFGKTPHDRFLIELTAEPFASFFSNISGLTLKELFAEQTGVWKLDEAGRRQVESIFLSISDEFKAQNEHYNVCVMMKIAELMLFIARLRADERTSESLPQTWKHTQINCITDYILRNYTTPISLDTLCSQFYISKSYLCGTFKEITGSTVWEYIHLCRVKRARELLENSDMSITEISALLGYGTVTHFERMFRRYMETSPLKYRKKMRLIHKKVRERKSESLLENSV
ncbi:MAG: AraC family transcriptional regulator [Oscillospiraceae bacterium]|nr:AraC family transcriptional regulator [Oscillospiraceae bacterium]